MVKIDIISLLNWQICCMKFKIWIALIGCLLFASCYRVGPDEGEVSTASMTNNPDAMRGPLYQDPLTEHEQQISKRKVDQLLHDAYSQ